MGVVTISLVRDPGYYEDYASLSNVPPRWLGSAVEADLGLARPPVVSELGPDGRRVREGDVVRLLDGRHPDTGASLLDGKSRQRGRRAGFDLTFSPPKSVSVLEMAARLSGDTRTADAVWAAHRAAVDATFAWMETELFVGRRGHEGRDGTVRARVAAVAFDHSTSRMDDPQIHTHVVLANLGMGEDGRWGSLWTDPFWRGAKSREHIVRDISAIYGATLRAELTQRLGVGWSAPQGRDHHREVAGISRRVLSEFSRRRNQVAARLAETGMGDGGKARQAAQLATRSEKSERLAAELAGEWAERLARLRVRPERILKQVGRNIDRKRAKAAAEPPMPDVNAVLADLHGPGGRPTFTRHDLMAALAAECAVGATPGKLGEWADSILASDAVVEVSRPLLPPPESEATAAHASAAVERYAASWLLAAEQKVVELSSQINRAGVPPETVEKVLAASTADPEQAAMVRSICGDGFVHVVAAAAGSGKTFALGVALKAWRAAGRDVIGITPSWRAANEMADVGVPSWAFDALIGPSGPGLAAIPRGGVVIVDESSMLPTRSLASIVEHAAKRGAQVVLVGDPRQLTSVEAGGLYALFAAGRGVVRLETNRRQAADWTVQALTDLREGRALRAAHAVVQAGDVLVAEDEAAAVARLMDDWWDARSSGAEVAILSATREGADALNALAHARLVAAGALGKQAVVLTASDKHGGLPERELRVGDEVRFRKRRTWTRQVAAANGDLATVESVSPTHIELRLHSGHVVRSTVSWATDHVDLGYATTIHAAQGRTVGTARAKRERGGQVKRGECFVLAADHLGLEAAYVASSRAVDRTRLYLAADPEPEHDSHLFDAEGRPIEPPPADPLERLVRGWGEVDAADAGVGEARRQERVAWLASHMGRAQLERLMERGEKLRRAAAKLPTAPDEAEDPDDPDAGESTPDDADLVTLSRDLGLLADALELQRRAAVADLALKAGRGEADWLTEIVGTPPPDRAGQLRWREAVGAVEDARHWVEASRLRSPSPRIQALAADVETDLLRLSRLPDRRPLEELVPAEAEARAKAALRERFPEHQHLFAKAPVVRQTRALVWLGFDGVDLDQVAKRADEIQGSGAPPVAAVATALREVAADEVARRLAAGKDVPLSVAAAVQPGMTIPAVRALIEAVEGGDEFREPEPTPEPEPRPTPTSTSAPAGVLPREHQKDFPVTPTVGGYPDMTPQGDKQWTI
jgi:conjugative relaxase-like TrwC/TraI family protein